MIHSEWIKISISSISSTKVDQELYLFFYFKLGRLHVNVCRNISASRVISLKSLKLDVMRNFRILISRLFVGLSFFDAKLVSGPFYIFLVCISVYKLSCTCMFLNRLLEINSSKECVFFVMTFLNQFSASGN